MHFAGHDEQAEHRRENAGADEHSPRNPRDFRVLLAPMDGPRTSLSTHDVSLPEEGGWMHSQRNIPRQSNRCAGAAAWLRRLKRASSSRIPLAVCPIESDSSRRI